MSIESEQPDSRKASFFDKIALFSAVIALLCVLGAHVLDRMAQDGALSALSSARSGPGIDYSGTASIGKPANVTLNPCGNR
jgi:uncharacterized protein YraI